MALGDIHSQRLGGHGAKLLQNLGFGVYILFKKKEKKY